MFEPHFDNVPLSQCATDVLRHLASGRPVYMTEGNPNHIPIVRAIAASYLTDRRISEPGAMR